MATYRNGDLPDWLLVRRGNFLLTRGTWAKWDALVADVQHRFGVTLRITDGVGVMKGTGAYRDRPMQRAVKAYYTKLGKPRQAATEGTSSHGGEFKGDDALAVDVTNYYLIPRAEFFAACRRAGFEPNFFDGKNGKPLEPWHIIDRDPYRSVGSTTGGNATPISETKPAPAPEEEEDMSKNILYKTIEEGAKYPIRAAVTNDTSGLWLEFIDNQAGTMNTLADRYETGDAVPVSGSMFAAARAAAAQIRPQTNLAVKVGTPDN